MAGSGKENAVSFQDKKYQGRKTLLFLDHDFTGYHTIEWYQWEVNVQLLAKGASQLNLANGIVGKVKALLVKLYAVHRIYMINIFSENKRQLKVENFPKAAKEIKDLLNYNIIDGCNKNVTMIIHVIRLIPFGQFKNRVFNWL
eukprot:6539904-Ditylum_brightwellii.AAC.1